MPQAGRRAIGGGQDDDNAARAGDPVEELSSTLGPEIDEDEHLEKAAEEFREKLARLKG
ncbi:MAG: hypothetical protein J7L75_06780 [Thermoproteales archaeon]|nr:hypothetical protein [Thermoproteales archaeon]